MEQLAPTLAATSPVIASIAAVLVDSGFYSAAAVAAAERGCDGQPGPSVYAATGRQSHGRSVEQLEKRDDPPAPEPGASAAAVLAHRLSTKAGRALYAQRKQTIEPVFGIIKAALGFRQFRLRGLGKVTARPQNFASSRTLRSRAALKSDRLLDRAARSLRPKRPGIRSSPVRCD